MKVAELIVHLNNFVAQSPENSHAEAVLLLQDGMCYNIQKGNDARGLPGQHYLIIIPDLNGHKFGAYAIGVQ